MILIEDYFSASPIMESVNGGTEKKLYLRGVFAEAAVKNRNGRIYDRGELEKAVNQINDAAASGRHILGCLDHPNTLEIKLEEVSHRLMNAVMEGNQVICKAEILEKHPKGAIAKALIESGVQLGVSTRGSGTVNESTGAVRNFGFVTVDLVATPSCRSAYPQTIQEQLEYYKKGGELVGLAEAVVHDKAAQKYFQEEMKKFIEKLMNSKS